MDNLTATERLNKNIATLKRCEKILWSDSKELYDGAFLMKVRAMEQISILNRVIYSK